MARRRSDDLEMEREFEERVEAKRRRGSPREYPDTAKRDRNKPKPPFLLRFLAWCGVILFCFVVGYVGTEYMVDKLGLNRPMSSDDTTLDFAAETLGIDMQRATFSVFYPRDGRLVSENVEVITRTLEDNIREAVLSILRFSGIDDAVNVLHVFRDIDTVYLNLSAPFLQALYEIGENTGSLLITGIARTMDENFSLTNVRYLVDSEVAVSMISIGLNADWQPQT